MMDSSRAGTSKDDEDDTIIDEPPKKILKTVTGGSALLDLRNELLKKRKEASAGTKSVVLDKKGVLYIKNDEKSRLKTEASERRARISAHEEALRIEAAAQVELCNRRLKEKAEMYDKLQESGISVDEDIGEGLVDFNAKKRDLEREKAEERERKRREEETAKEADAVHFVPNEEPRMYGASHVTFSRDEEKRQQQISDLLKMTDQTGKAREKTKSLSEKREEARRAKEKALREKLGLPPLPEPEPEPIIDPVIASIPLPEPPKVEDKPLPKKEREWDRGKGTVNNWVRSRREDRDDEFAPPSFY